MGFTVVPRVFASSSEDIPMRNFPHESHGIQRGQTQMRGKFLQGIFVLEGNDLTFSQKLLAGRFFWLVKVDEKSCSQVTLSRDMVMVSWNIYPSQENCEAFRSFLSLSGVSDV